MNSRQRRKQAACDHNGRYQKLKKLLELTKDHKDYWVIRVFGATMTEEQLDTRLKQFNV